VFGKCGHNLKSIYFPLLYNSDRGRHIQKSTTQQPLKQ
jgi:hypothetical protein